MRTYRSILATAAVSIMMALTGCVIVTDADDWDGSDGTSWQARQNDNNAYIADLRLGTPLDHVRADLGQPDFSEGYMSEGRDVLILRYRTHHRRSDGETTRDETTPLVFVDGQLAGWGEGVVQDYPIASYPGS